MLFNSYIFLGVFLPLTLAGYLALRRTVGLESSFVLLCVASLIYYAYWKATYLPILLVSILGNYLLGIILSNRGNGKSGKSILVFGVAANLAALGYYKYANFFIENLQQFTGQQYDLPNVALPLAISFFTFQQIAYLVDAHRGEVKEYKFVHYVLFVTFFPQLIAGPIVHHKEMLTQFMDRTRALFDKQLFWFGCIQFSIGLFKKVVIADTLALYATPVFSAADGGLSLTMAEAWLGTLAYTFQLYFDFSGYSDMALGIAMLFGINLPMNFNSPYKAVSISDFWRRWHMTLSRFLRDYLYIALGGNRKGPVRRYVNLFLTMLLGGLWHGASWNFVVWGALHGSYLVVNHGWTQLRHKMGWFSHGGRVYHYLALAVTFLAVIAAWVVFRAETFAGASAIYAAAFDFSSLPGSAVAAEAALIEQPVRALAVVLLAAGLAFMFPNVHEILTRLKVDLNNKEQFTVWRLPKFAMAVSAFTSLLLIVAVASITRVSEFLYFQF